MSEESMRSDLAQSYGQARRFAEDLGQTVRELRRSRADLERAYLDTVRRLALAVEYKDEETGAHVVRLSSYADIIARRAGLADEARVLIRAAAPMHDVGKIGIPDSILLKPGRLDEAEFETMKRHTVIGAQILADSPARVIQVARSIALTHHERFDGSGYPHGLAGSDIPVEGRIMALADVFDALTSKRPYKEAYPLEVALGIIESERGRHFDPEIVDAFMAGLDEVESERNRLADTGFESLEDFSCNEWDLACLESLSHLHEKPGPD